MAPVVDALDLSVPIAETPGVGGVQAQHAFLFRELQPEARCSATYLEMWMFSMTVLPARAARSS